MYINAFYSNSSPNSFRLKCIASPLTSTGPGRWKMNRFESEFDEQLHEWLNKWDRSVEKEEHTIVIVINRRKFHFRFIALLYALYFYTVGAQWCATNCASCITEQCRIESSPCYCLCGCLFFSGFRIGFSSSLLICVTMQKRHKQRQVVSWLNFFRIGFVSVVLRMEFDFGSVNCDRWLGCVHEQHQSYSFTRTHTHAHNKNASSYWKCARRLQSSPPPFRGICNSIEIFINLFD